VPGLACRIQHREIVDLQERITPRFQLHGCEIELNRRPASIVLHRMANDLIGISALKEGVHPFHSLSPVKHVFLEMEGKHMFLISYCTSFYSVGEIWIMKWAVKQAKGDRN
jgi:hypothetical protein